MTDTPTAVTIEELCTATGLGPRQVRDDVKAGLLPGRIRRHQLVLARGEFQRWLAGEWQPRSQPEPISLLHKRSA